MKFRIAYAVELSCMPMIVFILVFLMPTVVNFVIFSSIQMFGILFKILEVLVAVIIPCVVLQDLHDNPAIKPAVLWLYSFVRRPTTPIVIADLWLQESERLLRLLLDIPCLFLWLWVLYTECRVAEAVNGITWGPTLHYASVQTLVAQISKQVA